MAVRTPIPRRTLGIPAYFYPWPGDPWWRALAQAPAGTVVVMTPANGPGARPDPAYRAVVTPLLEAGVAVYGYVDSAYAARDAASLLAEVDTYVEWYAVTGVFIDQVTGRGEHLAAYRELAGAVRSRGLAVAMNPGQPVVEPEYAQVADQLMVFEGTAKTYAQQAFPAWMARVPASRLWHCVYDVADATACAQVLARADAANAGVLHVTDGVMPNPWDRLPPYWPQLVRDVASSEG